MIDSVIRVGQEIMLRHLIQFDINFYDPFLFIIIMQRRKLFSNLKNKPKLLLDRQRQISTVSDKNNDGFPLSIVKIKPFQENKKSINKQYQYQSYSKEKRQRSQKKVNFQIREANLKQKLDKSSKTIKSQSPQLHISNLQQFLAQTLRRLRYSPYVFCFSGDITLSSLFLQKIITIIMEQISINTVELNKIYVKLRSHFDSDEKLTDSIGSNKDIQQMGRSKCSRLKIQRSVSCKYPEEIPQCAINQEKHQTKNKFSQSQDLAGISSNVLQIRKTKSFQESNQSPFQQSTLAKQDAFVFQHLRDLNDYILNQPNKIYHEAFRVHKYLEEELFAYADRLSISKYGAKTYTTEIDITVVDSHFEREMRLLNRQIIQGSQPLDVKCKMLRNFTLQLRQYYDNIVRQLMKVIDRKTVQIKTFVSKTLKWQQNYIARKEYLNNLRKEYCIQLHFINETLQNLRQHVPASNRTQIEDVEESIGKIDRIYKLGNSFY